MADQGPRTRQAIEADLVAVNNAIRTLQAARENGQLGTGANFPLQQAHQKREALLKERDQLEQQGPVDEA